MNGWEVLGLQPTGDLREVRRAYAERSRDCHPEDDPEGFRRLYDAYQWAQAQARHLAKFRAAQAERELDPVDLEPVHHLSKGPCWKSGEKYAGYKKHSSKGPAPVRRPPGPRGGGVLPPARSTAGQDIDFDALFQKAAQARRKRLDRYREEPVAQEFIRRMESGEETHRGDWSDYFLTEEFLDAQYEEAYVQFLADYLSSREIPVNNLPYALSTELFMAYGFSGYGEGQAPPPEAAPLWELLAPQRKSDAFAKELERPEYVPRRESFLLYNRALALHRRTRGMGCPMEEWEELLRPAREQDAGPRQHPGLFVLLAHLVSANRDLDVRVCRLLYRLFDFSPSWLSRPKKPAKALYQALKARLGEEG